MAKHQFLSDEWFDAVDEIVATQGGEAPSHANVTMNLVITGTPWGDREMHMGAKEGKADWGRGHAEAADVTLTVDYDTAKEIFVSGNQQAGMQAFMQGKIKVQGDMSKLMAQQGGGGNEGLQKAIQDITE